MLCRSPGPQLAISLSICYAPYLWRCWNALAMNTLCISLGKCTCFIVSLHCIFKPSSTSPFSMFSHSLSWSTNMHPIPRKIRAMPYTLYPLLAMLAIKFIVYVLWQQRWMAPPPASPIHYLELHTLATASSRMCILSKTQSFRSSHL